ncbi:hypothetical protein MUK42_37349 [Musa troglodytarum]|uniref:Uncharacterized protein n=1 Tax=Musa troglodytarum TaxID=320322 RepID=A0A9E7FJ52_9LILI|nr:hypothetical protein MUK42_37349 [Musa troglodytarum]
MSASKNPKGKASLESKPDPALPFQWAEIGFWRWSQPRVDRRWSSGRALSPCWKKKAPDAGFLANVKDHFDQFVSTPMDQHRICLKKTIRGVGDYVKLRKQSKQGKLLRRRIPLPKTETWIRRGRMRSAVRRLPRRSILVNGN